MSTTRAPREATGVPPRDAALTRQRILGAARRHFSAAGYERTTVRAVAADAGVSPNLITRYFGGKGGLFAAARRLDLQVGDALVGPVEVMAERIAAKVVARWEAIDTDGDDPLLLMLRAAGGDPQVAAEVGEVFIEQAARPLADALRAREPGASDVEDRVAAASALIFGAVTMRYLMRAGPLAVMDRARLEPWLAAQLRRLLAPGDVAVLPTP